MSVALNSFVTEKSVLGAIGATGSGNSAGGLTGSLIFGSGAGSGYFTGSLTGVGVGSGQVAA